MAQRRQWRWTDLNAKRAASVSKIVGELEDYWPLTLRQIHYRLVEARPNWHKYSLDHDAPYQNTVTHYQSLSTLVKWMRIDEFMSWDVLTDRTRRLSRKRGDEDLGTFVARELDWFLDGYERCLVQSQDVYVELWIEKDALSSVFEDVARPFCLRVMTRRGYNSVTFEADYMVRARDAINSGRTPLILYFGDHDPSGNNMLGASLQTLETEMGLSQLETIRVALNYDQVESYALPPKPEAAKKSDPRYKEYVKKYGTSAWELDALHPKELAEIARNAIEEVFDMDSFEAEQDQEMVDRERLADLKAFVQGYINDQVEKFIHV